LGYFASKIEINTLSNYPMSTALTIEYLRGLPNLTPVPQEVREAHFNITPLLKLQAVTAGGTFFKKDQVVFADGFTDDGGKYPLTVHLTCGYH
jgi:hypothetical protein